MYFSGRTALVLFFLSLKVAAIGIIDFETCNFPYMIPRAFQTRCEPADEYVDDYMLPVKVGVGFKGIHPQWVTSMLIRTVPNIWSVEPWCLESEESNSGMCVYTSTRFAGGRGVSFIASPKEVPLIVQAEAFKNQTETEKDANPDHDDRMELLPVPGKGLGMRARHLFRRGDKAQAYTPIMVVQDYLMQHSKSTDQHLALRIATERLPPKTQELFMGLMGHWGGDPYYDRVNTNAFTSFAGQSFQYYWSVYPETSRYNHDCRPNTMYSIDQDSLLHVLRVSRTIIPGEEITLSYLAPNMNSNDRKARMLSQWGFNCTCTLCSSPQDILDNSDERVALIDALENELNDLNTNRTSDLSTAEFLVSLYEQERLDGVIGDAYMYAAFESAYVGLKRKTQMYASLALEHMALWRGVQHEYYLAMYRLFTQPEAQPSWEYFSKNKAAGNETEAKTEERTEKST